MQNHTIAFIGSLLRVRLKTFKEETTSKPCSDDQITSEQSDLITWPSNMVRATNARALKCMQHGERIVCVSHAVVITTVRCLVTPDEGDQTTPGVMACCFALPNYNAEPGGEGSPRWTADEMEKSGGGGWGREKKRWKDRERWKEIEECMWRKGEVHSRGR